jgi:hypothetical protein
MKKAMITQPIALALVSFLVAAPVSVSPAADKARPVISDGQRAAATWAVQNLMSRHEYMHAAGRNLEEIDSYWVSRTGPYAATATFGSPGWVMYGIETVRRAYGEQSRADAEKALAGLSKIDPALKNVPENFGAGAEWVMHTSTTPIIEIAGDGKSAQGAWYSPGMGIMPQLQDGKVNLQAMMFWEKYGADFIKENGAWKIWHLQMAYDFVPGLPKEMTDRIAAKLGQLATTDAPKPSAGEAGERMEGALPPGFRKPKYVYPDYSPQRASVIWPNLPKPYYTFKETFNNCNCDQNGNPDMSPITAAVDTNKDGKMTRAEWSAQGLPESSFNGFEKGRGYVTQQDYEVNTAPPGIDADGDGKLTVDEFKAFDKKMSAPMKNGKASPPPPPAGT